MDTYALPAYILWQYPQAKITPLKLQKLLYYVKVWGIVAGIELYDGEFERWDYGPVNPQVYHTYKVYGRQPIPAPPNAAQPLANQQALMSFILEAYLPFSPISLSAMTHKEAPWRDTAPGTTIEHNQIYAYYSQQPFAKNFLPHFDPANNPYYTLQSNAWHAFVLDMTPEDIERHTQFPSYQQYRKHFQQAQIDVADFEETLNRLLGGQ